MFSTCIKEIQDQENTFTLALIKESSCVSITVKGLSILEEFLHLRRSFFL